MGMRSIVLAAGVLPLLLPAGARAQAAFITGQAPDQRRASQLIGVDVLGPDGTKVGAVSDLLIDQDGRAAAVVIGVGGFLGVGQKEVALPYAAVHFASPARAGNAPAPAAAVGGPQGTTAGVPGGTVAGQAPAPAPGAPDGGTASPARMPRPDHATVDLAADQLKSAPAFAFAR